MVIYAIISEDGYVEGYGSTNGGNDNEVEIEIPEDHEFFSKDIMSFKYEGGELVFDKEVNDKRIREREKEELLPTDDELNAIAIMELYEKIMTKEGGA